MRLLRRAAFVVLAAVAVAAIVSGGVLAVHGEIAGRTGPGTAVRHYFAALQRGDAAAALSYGTVPSGDRALVGDTALRAQLRVAPLRSPEILSTRTTGDRAVVRLGYVLGFSDGPSTVSADVALHRTGGGWLLDAAAIPTRFAFDAAGRRVEFGGTRIPIGRALVFPGALPLHVDSSYLSATTGNGSITFGADATTDVQVALTTAGRQAARQRLVAALDRCLGTGGVTCPQPNERYLPGSVRGRTEGALRHVSIRLTGSPLGVIAMQARPAASVRFRSLDFTNRLRTGRANVRLDLHAEAVATAPLTIRWTR